MTLADAIACECRFADRSLLSISQVFLKIPVYREKDAEFERIFFFTGM